MRGIHRAELQGDLVTGIVDILVTGRLCHVGLQLRGDAFGRNELGSVRR